MVCGTDVRVDDTLTTQYQSIDWTQHISFKVQTLSSVGGTIISYTLEEKRMTRDQPGPGQLFRPSVGLISRIKAAILQRNTSGVLKPGPRVS